MRIGFIGLGNMGGSMALNLMKAGHQVTVNDVRRQVAEPHLAGGAKWAESSAAAAKDAEVVFTSLPGPREVEAVVLGEGGLIGAMAPGSLYIDLSTNSPTVVRADPRAAQGPGHPDARRARQRRRGRRAQGDAGRDGRRRARPTTTKSSRCSTRSATR